MSNVQARAAGINSTSITVSGLSASGAGNFLVAFVYSGDSTNVSGVTDSQSQTWTKYAGNEFGTSCWYKENTASGVTTVTASISVAARDLMMIVAERDDIDTSGSESATQNVNQEAGVTTWSSGNSGTPSQADTIAYGFAFLPNTAISVAASGAWAAVTLSNQTGAGYFEALGTTVFLESQTLASASAVAATGTCSSSIVESSVWIFDLASSVKIAWIKA